MGADSVLIDPVGSYLPITKKSRDQKSQGFITQREKGYHALRLRVPMGHLKTSDLPIIRDVAEKYGRGMLHLTLRGGIEIPWVKTEDLEEARAMLRSAGIVLAGCGPKMRAVIVCMGDVCPYSSLNTYKLGMEFDQKLFSADDPEIFPHKLKVSVAGCTIACSKPQFNDVGVMGLAEPGLELADCTGCALCAQVCKEYGSIDDLSQAFTMVKNEDGDPEEIPIYDPTKCIYCSDCIRVCPTDALFTLRTGLALFIGGKYGRHPRWGTRVANFLTEEELFVIVDRVREWWKKTGKRGERLGQTMDRLGLDKFKEEVLSGGTWEAKILI